MMVTHESVCGSQYPPQQSVFVVQAPLSATQLEPQTSAPFASGAQTPEQHCSPVAHEAPLPTHVQLPPVHVPEQQSAGESQAVPIVKQPKQRYVPIGVCAQGFGSPAGTGCGQHWLLPEGLPSEVPQTSPVGAQPPGF